MRDGEPMRSVARRLGVGLATVQLWVARSAGAPLASVDWRDRPSAPARTRRTDPDTERLVLGLRRSLRDESALGEHGAAAIRRELEARGGPGPLPSVRTIGRILERGGALDGRRRVRRPAPPPGWYLHDVRERRAELDSFDFIDGLWFRGGAPLDVLTGISLHGGLPLAVAASGLRSAAVVEALDAHWRRHGRPAFAQFDNDARFVGGASVPDSVGAVIRFCLAARVTPVFAPPRETGFQASVEAWNGRWQRGVWRRVWADDLAGVQARSAAYVAAAAARSAPRIEAAPDRPPLDFPADPGSPAAGRIVLLRRTDDAGRVVVLNRRYPVDPLWANRLVRADLDIGLGRIDVFALRRREPADHRQIAELPFAPPARWLR